MKWLICERLKNLRAGVVCALIPIKRLAHMLNGNLIADMNNEMQNITVWTNEDNITEV